MRYAGTVERKLPAQYQGWQAHQPALRKLTTNDLITEIQDGPPDRRLAALSVIDLSDIGEQTLEDWIRMLPDADVNELAGAIPAQSGRGLCEDHVRWAYVARRGYDRRRLPTFLVMLFSSLEALDARGCPQATETWEAVGTWLGDLYDRLVEAGDDQALQDLSLFVFENYLDRAPIFEAFSAAVVRHRSLARWVSADPTVLLSGLSTEKQKQVLRDAEAAGGLPFKQSWATLQGYEIAVYAGAYSAIS